MTKEQFEQFYAANSELSVEQLHALGLHAEPCDCEYQGCRGWTMLSSFEVSNVD